MPLHRDGTTRRAWSLCLRYNPHRIYAAGGQGRQIRGDEHPTGSRIDKECAPRLIPPRRETAGRVSGSRRKVNARPSSSDRCCKARVCALAAASWFDFSRPS